MTHNYFYSGLRVASELPLPEWSGFECLPPFHEADVVIALDGAQTLESPQTGQDFITSDEYRFRVQHVGSYWIRAGLEIVVTPTPDAGMREVRLFLLGRA